MGQNSTRLQTALATAGVIGSLLFVGFEIRQNTLAVRGETIRAISEQTFDFIVEGVQDDDWVRIITFLDNGGARSELTPEDRTRHSWMLGASLRIMENRYRQAQLGLISWAEVSTGGGSTNTNWYRSQHFLDFWRSRDQSTTWTPEFIEFMETEVLGIR